MLNHILSTLKDDKGKAFFDYTMILSLVTVIAMGALAFLGGYFSTTLM